jgi:hypothetical protein
MYGVMHFRSQRHDKRDSILTEFYYGGYVNGNMVGVTCSLQGYEKWACISSINAQTL